MIFLQIIKRELKIATRKQAEILNPLWFFLIVITLFPLVIGPDPKLLSRIAPGVAWVAALLSALLSFERLFRDDFIDGSLEQLMLTAQPLALTALAKVVAHWLLTGSEFTCGTIIHSGFNFCFSNFRCRYVKSPLWWTTCYFRCNFSWRDNLIAFCDCRCTTN